MLALCALTLCYNHTTFPLSPPHTHTLLHRYRSCSDDPLALLETTSIVERFKKDYSSDATFFQSLIQRHFVDNPHRLDLIMTPSKAFQEVRPNTGGGERGGGGGRERG